MNIEITEGKIKSGQKVVIYGTEGIGKTTFASKFPEPVFIDTEGSTKNMDVKRLPNPQSWNDLLEEINYVGKNKPCKTLVIDTIDWAESLCIDDVCKKKNVKSIEDIGYGKGHVLVEEQWREFLRLLEKLVDTTGINVVLTAHAIIRKFEQPDEMGSYDRYELKLGNKTTRKTAPLTKEWADMVLFANYKTYAVQVDKEGKKHKAQGGERVMYTTHHPCWDAKNRHGLGDCLEFKFEAIKHIFDTPLEEYKKQELHTSKPLDHDVSNPTLSKLYELMDEWLIGEEDIRKAVAMTDKYSEDTKIEDYDMSFIENQLINKWDKFTKFVSEKVLLKK